MYLEESKFLEIVRNTPLVAIDLVVRNENNEILLGLRKSGPAEDTWFVPGGRILKDEKFDDAFRRITKEELGVAVDVNDARRFGVFEHHYKGNFSGLPDITTHYVTLAYTLKLSAPHPEMPRTQHSDYRWLSEKELLRDEKVHPYTKAYFQRGITLETGNLIGLYNIYQTAISYYTNIIWAFPAAFFVLNFIAWSALEKTPPLKLIIAISNLWFVQAFFKLVQNQSAIVNVLRNVEQALSQRMDRDPMKNFVPQFKYGWFTKIKSADLFKWGIFVFTLGYLIYAIVIAVPGSLFSSLWDYLSPAKSGVF